MGCQTLPIKAGVGGTSGVESPKMAEEIRCSKSWVKKWLRRIRSVSLEDQQVMYGLSRTPKHPSPHFGLSRQQNS